MAYLVCYQPMDSKRDCTDFIKAIQSHQDWLQVLSNVWLVNTTEPCDVFKSRLSRVINEHDKMFILSVNEDNFCSAFNAKPFDVVSLISRG